MADEEIGARLRLKDRKQFQRDAKGSADDITRIGDAADKAGTRASGSARGWLTLRGGLSALKGVAVAGAVGLGIAGVAAGALGIKSLKLASDANETASALTQVMGPSIGEVRAELGGLTSEMGIPTQMLESAAVGFGAFGAQAGVSQDKLADFSTDLVKAGLDLGSFWNKSNADTFAAIQSGLSGEAEPLRQFGIFMSDAALSAKSMQMGLGDAFSELDEGTKIAVRQKFILDNLGAAQNDLARTADSPANAWRRFTGILQQGATAIGSAVLPAGGKLVYMLGSKLQPLVNELTRTAPLVGPAFKAAFSGEGVTSGGLVGVAERLGVASQYLVALWRELSSNSLAGFVGNLDRVTGSGGQLVAAFDKMMAVGRNLWTLWETGISPALKSVANALPGPLRLLVNPLRSIDEVTRWLAVHGEQLRPVIVALVALYTANKVAALGLAAAEKISVKEKSALVKVIGGVRTALSAEGRAKIATRLATMRDTAANVVNRGAKIAGAVAAKALAAAQWLLNAAMTANPITLVVVALVALVAGVVLAYQKVGWFRDLVQAAFGAVVAAGKWVLNFFKNNWQTVLALLTGPIGVAVLLVVKHWDTIKDAVAGAVEWVGDRLGDLVGFWTALPGRVGRALLRVARIILAPFALGYRLVVGAGKLVTDGALAIVGFLRRNWPLILAILTGPFGIAVLLVVKHFDKIKGAVTAVARWVGDRVSDLVGFFTSIPGRVGDVLAGPVNLIRNAATAAATWVSDKVEAVVGFFAGLPWRAAQVLQGIATIITAPFRMAFNAIARLWNSTVGKLSFKIPGWVPGVGGKGFDVPDMPTMALGGVVRSSGWAVTGEAGPEVGWWPTGSMVIPAEVAALPTSRVTAEGLGSVPAPVGADSPDLADLAGLWPDSIEVPVFIDGREVARAVKKNLRDEDART